MTELQKLYKAARTGRLASGKTRGHHAALRHMAVITGIDEETIDRCLKRARRAEMLDARRAKTVAA